MPPQNRRYRKRCATPEESWCGRSKRARDVASSSTQATTQKPSALMAILLYEVMWGFMQPTLAHRIARAAAEDGIAHPDLDNFVKMGTGGVHERNVWRDLCTRLRHTPILRAIGNVSAPLVCPPAAPFDGDLDMLYPHALFATIYTAHPAEFEKRILGGTADNVPLFWDAMARPPQHPSYATHPMLNHPHFDYRTRGVPLSLHGDGVTSIACGKQWARTVEVLSWSSVLAPKKASHIVNYIMLMIFKTCLVDVPISTMSVIWTHVIWSLHWLYLGLWPDRDANRVLYTPADGWKYDKKLTPLAGGWFMVTWLKRCDLEFGRDYWGHNDYSVGTQPCTCCQANDTDLPWTDCRPIPDWLATVWTDVAYAIAHPRRHRLLRHLPGLAGSMQLAKRTALI